MINAIWMALALWSSVSASASLDQTVTGGNETDPAAVARVEVTAARQLVKDGKALLVCAYDSDEKFAKLHLEGAISRADFTRRLATLPKDTVLIFYCA